MRGGVDLRGADPARARFPQQAAVHVAEILARVVTQADSLLIGYDRQPQPRILQLPKPLDHSWQNFHLRGVVQKGNVADERAVAVEQNQSSNTLAGSEVG